MADNGCAFINGLDIVGKVADVIDKVKKALDDLDPGRSAILTVHNNTDAVLVLTGQSLDHGNFGVPPIAEVPPHTALVFGGKSDGFLTGTSGHVFLAIGPTSFDVYWDNPYLGSTSCDLHASGPNALDYTLYDECGGGNQDAPMTYEVYPQPAAFGAMLVNKNSGKALDVPGFSADNVLIQQYSINGGANQRWRFTKVAENEQGPVYTLTNQSSQKCMDVVGAVTDVHAQVQQYPCHGGPNQQWRFVPVGDGYFAIISVNSGLCLDIPNSSGADGVWVQQYPFQGHANQQWRLAWEYRG